MLQQTRLETVRPYFERWIERFPTIESLARASSQQVLAAWEGLGYYGRARNLHKAALVLMEDYHGQLPEEVSQLTQLPGVGRYTAGAIASIAFSLDEPAVDGNVRRVLARYYNITAPVHSPSAEQEFWKLAAQHLPTGQAGLYNQALMDLGAVVCTPKSPACYQCPLQESCQAKALGIQEQRPVMPLKPAIPHFMVTAAVIHQGKKVLITRRPLNGLLGGLWEFPGGKQEPGEDLPGCLVREIREELGMTIQVGQQLGVYHHAYTHFRVTVHTFYGKYLAGEPRPLQVADFAWVSLDHLAQFPMGKVDRQISKDLIAAEVA